MLSGFYLRTQNRCCFNRGYTFEVFIQHTGELFQYLQKPASSCTFSFIKVIDSRMTTDFPSFSLEAAHSLFVVTVLTMVIGDDSTLAACAPELIIV